MNLTITNYVLGAISNDYEDFEMVFSEVGRWAKKKGLDVTREDVILGLKEAIDSGNALAYVLSPQPPHAQPVAFSRENLEQLSFYVTAKGKKLVEESDKP